MDNEKVFKVPPDKIDQVCLAVTRVVAGYFKNPNLLDKNRKRENCKPRQVCHHILKTYTNIPLSKIGLRVSHQDHATVLHSSKAVMNDCFRDSEYTHEIEIISGMARNTIYESLHSVNPDLLRLRDKIATLRSIVNGNKFGQESLAYVESFIKEKIIFI
jgi:hypothetical protein